MKIYRCLTLILLVALAPAAYAKKQSAAPANAAAQYKQYERDKRKNDSERKKLLMQSTKAAKNISRMMEKVKPLPRPDVDVKDAEVEPLKTKAEAGDAAAMVRLGHYYMMHPVPGFANEGTAGTWFSKAAATGDADAIAWFALYEHLVKGKNLDAALRERFRDSAEKGSMLGEYLMGLTEEKHADKIPWFEKAAKRGFVPAMRGLSEAISDHTYHDIPALQNYNVTPEAIAWAKLAAANDDYLAYGLLSKEGAFFSGLESERPNIDFKKLESYSQKELELAKKVPYTWYGSVFDTRLMVGRYSWGGPRSNAILQAYSDGYQLLDRHKKLTTPFIKKFQADMTKLADAGDRDAMLVITKAAKNWRFFFPTAPQACPFKPEPYAQKLAEMSKNDPLLTRLINN